MKIKVILYLSLLSFIASAQQTVGVFKNTSESFNGYTLFSNNLITYLIDNCGFVVNQWESGYRPGINLYLLANGNLLRSGKLSSEFSTGGIGGRFEIFNWENQPLWAYEVKSPNEQAHHDMEPLPNGNFLALVWERISNAESVALGHEFNSEKWSEKIIEIKPIGNNDAEIVWEWKLRDHLIQDFDPTKLNFGNVSNHPEKIDFNFRNSPNDPAIDFVHLNSISYNEDLDQIAVSAREYSEIWIIDHSTTTQEAIGSQGGRYGKGGDILYRFGNPQAYKTGGPDDQKLFEQHSVSWIANDQLMVFNNKFLPNQSAIQKWTIPSDSNGNYTLNSEGRYGPEEMDFTYTEEGLFSHNLSSAQLLENNNILICVGQKGHFFEIDSNHEMHWEYINPVNHNGGPVLQGGTPRFNQIFSIKRYGPNFPGFVGKDLTPRDPVELAPWDTGCELSILSNTEDLPNTLDEITVQNPISSGELLHVFNPNSNVKASLYNLQGQYLSDFNIVSGNSQIQLPNLASGIYILSYGDIKRVYHIKLFYK